MFLTEITDMSLLLVAVEICLDLTSVTYYFLNFGLLFRKMESMEPALYDSGAFDIK